MQCPETVQEQLTQAREFLTLHPEEKDGIQADIAMYEALLPLAMRSNDEWAANELSHAQKLGAMQELCASWRALMLAPRDAALQNRIWLQTNTLMAHIVRPQIARDEATMMVGAGATARETSAPYSVLL